MFTFGITPAVFNKTCKYRYTLDSSSKIETVLHEYRLKMRLSLWEHLNIIGSEFDTHAEAHDVRSKLRLNKCVLAN